MPASSNVSIFCWIEAFSVFSWIFFCWYISLSSTTILYDCFSLFSYHWWEIIYFQKVFLSMLIRSIYYFLKIANLTLQFLLLFLITSKILCHLCAAVCTIELVLSLQIFRFLIFFYTALSVHPVILLFPKAGLFK